MFCLFFLSVETPRSKVPDSSVFTGQIQSYGHILTGTRPSFRHNHRTRQISCVLHAVYAEISEVSVKKS